MLKRKNKFKYLWIIGLFLPFIGLPLYFIVKNMEKESKSNLKTSIIIGFAIWIFVGMSFLIKTNGPGPKVEKEYFVSEWLEDTKEDKPVVTVIGMTTCGYCQQYKPVIEQLAEEKEFNLYFFESDALSAEDATLVESTYELSEYEGYVPFTFIVQNGEVIAQTTGYESKDTVIDFLTKNGVMK